MLQNKQIMKAKIIVSFLMIFLFSCCSNTDTYDSCAKEEAMDAPQALNNISIQNAKNQIEILNEEMFPKTNVETRGFLSKFFKKLYNIVVADAVGGLMGLNAGPCGAAASAILSSATIAIIKEDRITNNEGGLTRSFCADDSEDNGVTLQPTTSANTALKDVVPNGSTSINDSIGYIHNQVLINVKARQLPSDSLLFLIAQNTSEVYGVESAIVENEVLTNKDLYDIIGNKNVEEDDSNTLEELISKWKQMFPEKSDEISIIGTFMSGLSNLEAEENDGSYLEKVLEIIDNSDLDESTRQNIRNSFIVANASYKLWKVEE